MRPVAVVAVFDDAGEVATRVATTVSGEISLAASALLFVSGYIA
jgi:hypothetical protein